MRQTDRDRGRQTDRGRYKERGRQSDRDDTKREAGCQTEADTKREAGSQTETIQQSSTCIAVTYQTNNKMKL